MAIVYVSYIYGSATGSGTEVDSTAALTIESGDLLVAVVKWDGTTTTITSLEATTSPANKMTMEAVNDSTSICNAMGYKIGATGNTGEETSTFKLTIGAEKTYRAFIIMQFRPDAGETVTKVAGPSMADGTGTALLSDTISPSGSDIVVTGGCSVYDGTISDGLIGGNAADGVYYRQTFAGMWYKIFNSAQTDIAAGATLSASQNWICDILGFNSAIAAAGGSVPIMAQYYRRLRQ